MTKFNTTKLTISEDEANRTIKPLFDSLINQNVSEEVLINVFFDMNVPYYFNFLPPNVKEDKEILMQCLKRNLIKYDELPEKLKTTEYISRELFLSLLENRQIYLSSNLYPQDEDIILESANDIYSNFQNIDNELKKDKNLILKLIKKEKDTWNIINIQYPEIKSMIFADKEFLKELIKIMPSIYLDSKFKEEYKQSTEFIKILFEMKDVNVMNLISSYLKKNDDKDIALMALKLNNKYYTYLNLKYKSIIIKNNAKGDAYNFLKSYFIKENLEEDLVDEKTNKRKNKL